MTLTATGLAAHRDANRFFESGYAAFAEALPVDEAAAARWLSVIRGAVETAAESSGADRQPSVTGRPVDMTTSYTMAA